MKTINKQVKFFRENGYLKININKSKFLLFKKYLADLIEKYYKKYVGKKIPKKNRVNFLVNRGLIELDKKDHKYLVAMIDSFIEMILESESKKSINLIDDSILEKHFSNHIDNYSMISNNGQNYSEICGLIREMAVTSYKLTEHVMTNKLGFVPIPGYYDGSVDI